MIKFLLEILLIDSIDAILILLMVFGFNLRNTGKVKIVFTLVLLSFLLRLIPAVTFGIPIVSQVLMIIFSGLILSKTFCLNLKKCLIDIFILVFVIFLTSECLWFITISNFVDFNNYPTYSVFYKFLCGIPARVLELLLIYIYSKGVWNMGAFWFFNKQEEKEVEVEAKVTEEEETEE